MDEIENFASRRERAYDEFPQQSQGRLEQWLLAGWDLGYEAGRDLQNKAGEVQWADPDVQTIYELLCDNKPPPEGEHYEGWIAMKIADALRAPNTPDREG